MEVLKKKILLKDILSLANYGNKLTPYDKENDEWLTNNFGEQPTYMKPVSDIKNPVYNKQFNIAGYNMVVGVATLEYLSYQDLKRMDNYLHTFQLLMEEMCTLCEEIPPIDFIETYINNLENYILYGGDELLINIVDILNLKHNVTVKTNPVTTIKERYFKYYQIDNTLFLNYILNKESEFLGYELSLNTLFNNNQDQIKEFINNYFSTDRKITLITDLMFNAQVIPTTSLNSNIGQQRNEFFDRFNTYMIDFFKERNCKKNEIILNNTFNELHNPTLKFNILLTQDYSDMGIYTNGVEEWYPGRTYNIGNIVMFEGNTYILVKGNSETDNTYSGNYNEYEKLTFFDTTDNDPSTGFVLKYRKYNGWEYNNNDNDVDYDHWKRTVRPNETPVYSTVSTRINSQLISLKSYWSDETIANFFDTEGKFKTGIEFNQTYFQIGENQSGVPIYRKYYSIIDNIISSEPETGHDIVEYHYTIDKCDDDVNSGLKCVDTYHRFKINNTGIDEQDYRYQFDEVVISKTLNDYKYNNILTNVEFKIKASNNINNSEPDINNFLGNNENLKTNVYNKSDESIFNYNNLIREEYLTGTMMEPKVDADVYIDRGINYALDRHLKMGECKTLEDLISYGNNSLLVRNNNE